MAGPEYTGQTIAELLWTVFGGGYASNGHDFDDAKDAMGAEEKSDGDLVEYVFPDGSRIMENLRKNRWWLVVEGES